MEEINYRSAVDQLALINDKSISCVELLNAHIDQLNRINPEVICSFVIKLTFQSHSFNVSKYLDAV